MWASGPARCRTHRRYFLQQQSGRSQQQLPDAQQQQVQVQAFLIAFFMDASLATLQPTGDSDCVERGWGHAIGGVRLSDRHAS